MTEDTGITITLTAKENLALSHVIAFYMKHATIDRKEITEGLQTLIFKLLPHVQQKAKE